MLLAIAIGYVIGSIPVADIVSRRAGAPNLRDVGDKNPGFWNSRSVLSRNQSLTIFVGDLLKGVLAVAIAQELSATWQVWFVAAAAAMIGHAWPLFARFQGGRSVLTWVGAAIVLSPLPAAFSVLMFLLFWAATRDVRHGVRIGVVLYPLSQWYADGPWFAAATGALMSIIGLRFAMAIGIGTVLDSVRTSVGSVVVRTTAPLARWRNDATRDRRERDDVGNG